MRRFSFIFSVSLVIALTDGQSSERCAVARTGGQGVCRLMRLCRPALIELEEKGLLPATCGFENGEQVVCCALPPTPKTTVAPISRISYQSECLRCAEALAEADFQLLYLECKEYQNAVYETVYVSVGLEQVERKVFRCNIADVPLIIGGTTARPKEFPHMVIDRPLVTPGPDRRQ